MNLDFQNKNFNIKASYVWARSFALKQLLSHPKNENKKYEIYRARHATNDKLRCEECFMEYTGNSIMQKKCFRISI